MTKDTHPQTANGPLTQNKCPIVGHGSGRQMSKRDSELYLDFEFCRVTHPKLNLVSCATYDQTRDEKMVWWLHNNKKRQRELSNYLKQYELLIGYAFVAEARAMLSLDLNPVDWQIIDMFLEYRMMTNHNDQLQWGKQLVDGKVKNTRKPKPKWERTEEDGETGFKASHSLAEATYKLTGEIRDTTEKTEVRNLIISDPESFRPEEKKRILRYNLDDVVFLPKIWERLQKEFGKLDDTTSLATYRSEAIVRGRYAALTAKMEARGYPINVESTRNFSRQVPHILMECQRDINNQFPDAKPFRWNKRPCNFSWNQITTRQWIEKNCDAKFWMKTDGGKKRQPQLSLSLEAWEKQFQFKHTYPRGNFGAQMVRYLKLKQSLYGFSESGGKRKNFWDSVGPDNRVRPYMNIFGAQSSRSQPGASGFMFLKPAWMRSLVQPAKGRFMFGIDYGQQEFFLSGLVSKDQNMIDAYLSGDPYLWGAKKAGVIPEHGTKSSHKIERDLFKNTYLGILYGMTKYGLAIKLTGDSGRLWTEDEAQVQIDLFEEMFPVYMEWKENEAEIYTELGAFKKLPCGWRMWGDNDNVRSVMNVPIQGFGASIMRNAVYKCDKRGVDVVFTLHDANYGEDTVNNLHKIGVMHDAMKEAFKHYFRRSKYYDLAGEIKLDPFAWSPDFKADSELEVTTKLSGLIKIPCSNMYIDERAGDEYERFKKYFDKPEFDLL